MTTTAAGHPPADRDPAHGPVIGGPAADLDGDDGVVAGSLGERITAWLSPTPAELLGLALLLAGSVAATLVWWYGSVAAPADATAMATAGTSLAEDGADTEDLVDHAATGQDPQAWARTDQAPQEPAPTDRPHPGEERGFSGATEVGTAGAVLMVHVSGAVQRPGLVTLPGGARVGDGVAAAGGLTADADAARVNLARVLVDGEQVHVPREGEEPPPATADGPATAPGEAGPQGGSGEDPEGRIDLNRASADELETLPGIGPARASAIVAHREEHGPFQAPGDLRAVSGIGEATFQNLAPLIVVR